MLLNATRRHNEQGNIIGVVSIGQDITSSLAQEHGYSCLIDAANTPIFGVDMFGCINGRNKCASYLIEYSTKAVMGQSRVQECITDSFMTVVQFMVHRAKLEAAVAASSKLGIIGKADEGDEETVLSMVAAQRKRQQEVECMAAEARAHDKEAAWMKEQQKEACGIADQGAYDEEATAGGGTKDAC